MPSEVKDALDFVCEMHGGGVKHVRMRIANLPEKTPNGNRVSSGSLHWDFIAERLRGHFVLHGEELNKIEADIPTSGPFGFFFDWEGDDDMSIRLTDEKGKFPDGDRAIVKKMTCFCENPDVPYQFSELVNESEQGKAQGLGSADILSGVITLHLRFLRDPEVRALKAKGLCTRGGAPRKSFNGEVGLGAYTGTTWKTSNQVPVSEIKTMKFRIKVGQRETEKPVAFASTLQEAQKKYGPSEFEPDDMSDDDEKQPKSGDDEKATSGDDEKRKSGDDD
tara:strand:- start:36539 stop:37372 length:834 start_codon:yes stop_codon:yes gene_type:complete